MDSALLTLFTDSQNTMSAEKVDVREILAALDATEMSIKSIVSSAAETAEQLAQVPVCNEKKLKALACKYLSNVRTVQEDIKEHAYVLDLDVRQGQTAGHRMKDGTASKRAEFESRLAMLEAED